MTTAKIGLKLANGAFYPVLQDGVPARKRLVVTTVKDGQKSVQIDLYRGHGPRVEDAAYIGSLVVENIREAPRGEPDIRLELGLRADGLLSASAEDPSSGERQNLRVSLESLPEEEKYEIPDFEFEEDETDTLPQEVPPLGESAEESAGLLASAEELRAVPRPRRVLLMVLTALLALVLALVFAFFVYRCSTEGRNRPQFIADEQPSVASIPPAEPPPALEQAPPPPPVSVDTPPTPELPPVAAPPVKVPANQPPPPAPASPVKPAGIRYRIRWGDTLWDLAYAHYHNPWLYPKIAAANKIKNPDLIISGTWIIIPPR